MKYYILIDENGSIKRGWSNGLDSTEGILVAEGNDLSFQFYLPGFEELGMNPPLYTEEGIPMYKWDGEKVIVRTQEEIETDLKSIPEPPPTETEILQSKIDFLMALNGMISPPVQTFAFRSEQLTIVDYIQKYYPKLWGPLHLMKLVEVELIMEEDYERLVES